MTENNHSENEKLLLGAHFYQEGNRLVEEGRIEEAEETFLLAIESGFQEAKAYGSLALTKIALGKEEEAIASFYQAMEAEPDFPLYYNLLVNFLEEGKKYEELLSLGRLISERFPEVSYGFIKQASALAMLERFGEADEVLTANERRFNPESLEYLMLKGKIAAGLKDTRKAIEATKKLAEVYHLREAYVSLAVLYCMEGADAEAEHALLMVLGDGKEDEVTLSARTLQEAILKRKEMTQGEDTHV